MQIVEKSLNIWFWLDCEPCAQVFGDEANMNKLEDVQFDDLGQVSEVTITKDDCLLMKVSHIFF